MKAASKPVVLSRTALVIAIALAVSGCSSSGGERQSGPAYEMSRNLDNLEIPPDLIAPDTERAYRIPDAPGERVSAREMQEDSATRQQQRTRTAPGSLVATEGVLPESTDIQLMRDGSIRWLLVEADPGQIWGSLAAFWDTQNLRLARNEPDIGIMETEWAEDRAGIPLRGSQNIFARAIGNVYDAATRDQYRTRVERMNGHTAVYISHRGAEEKAEGETWRWSMRPSDPELEAEMLNRLRVYLSTGEVPEGRIDAPEPIAGHPTTVEWTRHDDMPALTLGGEYDRVWAQLGTFLDRAGLLVDEQDRRNGIYEVTYRPDIVGEDDSPGFFGRLFGRGGDRRANERYQIHLMADGERLKIQALDLEGQPLSSRDAEFVLRQIEQQMLR